MFNIWSFWHQISSSFATSMSFDTASLNIFHVHVSWTHFILDANISHPLSSLILEMREGLIGSSFLWSSYTGRMLIEFPLVHEDNFLLVHTSKFHTCVAYVQLPPRKVKEDLLTGYSFGLDLGLLIASVISALDIFAHICKPSAHQIHSTLLHAR